MPFSRLRGTGVSPGVAIGEVLLTEKVAFPFRKESIPGDKVQNEIKRLGRAVERTRKQLILIKDKIKAKVGEEHAFIFEAHLLILEDKTLLYGLEKIIREEKARAEWAISRVHDKYLKIFDAIADEYFRERKSDVSDVLLKLYRNLEPAGRREKDDDGEKILIAHDLLPSEAASRLSRGNVLAVALDMGGKTSHTAILARSLNIPAVVGLRNITRKVKDGDRLIVDGTDGEVIINPPLAIRKEFISKQKKYDDYQQELKKTAKLTPATRDNIDFFPMANIELSEEVSSALSLGAEGIGLFRSEFIYFRSITHPSEEDHYQVYSRLAKDAHPRPVYIRTVDVGGEKRVPQMKVDKEPNPALGLRAIRLSLRDRPLFKIQIRAVLRASVLGNLRVIIPMITEFEEIEEVKQLFREVKQELRSEKIKFDENIPIGVMIEVPAAAAITDLIVQEVDFISVGTNDLIQYYLAVDRSNEQVSYLYKPLHPSVLRLLKYIIETARDAGKDVAVCGEMAADPLSALVLLGLGLRTFSMNPIFIPRIKKALRSVDCGMVTELVQQAMSLRTAQEVEEFIIENVLVQFPEAFLMGQAT